MGHAPAAELCEQVDLGRGVLEWKFGENKVLTYAFASNQFKPYVRELYTWKGENVLRDAPADHLHHHGLMYAVRINNVNFWEEGSEAGYQVATGPLTHRAGTDSRGRPQASLNQLLHWVPSPVTTTAEAEGRALVVERRTLTLTVDEAHQEIALRWHAEFEVGSNPIKIHGTAYNGLGFRLPESWDHVSRHLNSENTPYSKAQTFDVTPARWAAISQAAAGSKTTVALFGHPRNRGETRFFSMLNAFAYLAVTQRLDTAPIEYPRGEKFALDYLVLTYASPPAPAVLEERYARWLREEETSK